MASGKPDFRWTAKIWTSAAFFLAGAVVATGLYFGNLAYLAAQVPANASLYYSPIPANAQLYSSPEFCITTQSGSPPCLNATLGGTVPGTAIQTWGRTTVADPDSRFEAFLIGAGLVTKVAPFKEDLALNSSFPGYQVVEFEAFTGSHPTGQCISTKGAYKQQDANGGYFYGPITLQPCDYQNDDNDTWAVWFSGGSIGHPITMVSLSNTTGIPQQLACVPDGSITACQNGASVVTVTAGAPNWAHFQECTPASSAQPQARCMKSPSATGPSSTTPAP